MTLFGPDLSNNRNQGSIDMTRVAAEGHSFVIAKVSEGATYRSPAWPAQRDGARRAGLVLAGYHMVSSESATAQAANCLAALGSDTSTPLALDWEESGNSGDWANFLNVLHAFQAAGMNVRFAYAPHWYWVQTGSPDLSTARLPVWASSYVNGAGSPQALYAAASPAELANRWASYGGASVELLQFTSSATVAGLTCDCSAFVGTRDQLLALFGYTPAPSSAPPKDAPMYPVPLEFFNDAWLPDPAGLNFRGVMPAETTTGEVVVKAWARWTCRWGTVVPSAYAPKGWKIVAWDSTKPLGEPPDYNTDWWRLPDTVRSFTVEGRRSGPQVIPVAALLTKTA